MLIKDLIAEVLSDVAPKHRAKTQEYYFLYLGELSIELGHHDVNQFSQKQYLAWMRGFRIRKKRKTFNDYTKFLNIAFHYAYKNRYATHWIKFPTTDIKEDESETGRVYTFDECVRMVAVMREETQLQWSLSYDMFMRLREMLHLEWNRVDFEKRVVILRKQDVKTGSRTGRGRIVPMSENVFRRLKRHYELQGKNQRFLFPSPKNPNKPVHKIQNPWDLVKKKAKIKGRARWHDIRHTALSHAVVVRKLPIAHVSKVAGVSMRTLERVYLHFDIDHLRVVSESMNILETA